MFILIYILLRALFAQLFEFLTLYLSKSLRASNNIEYLRVDGEETVCLYIQSVEIKWVGFLATFVHIYRLNRAKRTSWGWWDEWDDAALQAQDLIAIFKYLSTFKLY